MGPGGRYELKYVVGESRAVAIREFVRGHLQPSVYNRAGPVAGEPVITLYLDSPDLALYRQGADGLKNRFKLRIRFYDDDWQHPAFLEVKRRVSDVIIKRRAMVSRETVRQVLSGGWPNPRFWPDRSLLLDGKEQRDAVPPFFHLCHAVRARGVIYVSYLREAWESPGDGLLRVTFDRHVKGTLYDGTARLAQPTLGVRPDLPDFPPGAVVLEIKFTHRCPRWLAEMVQTFNLHRRSVSKYCTCIEALGLPRGLRPSWWRQEEVLL